MRNAPSVRYPVGHCVFYARLLVLLAGLGLALLVAAEFYARKGNDAVGAAPTGRVLIGAGFWLVWMAFAWWSWRRAPAGQLHWDALAANIGHPEAVAGAWRWYSDAYRDGAVLLRVEWPLDLQSQVLLRLHNPDGATSWVWLERHRDPARWDDLRRALMAQT